MHFKICSKCGKSKNLEDFYVRKSGNRAGKYYEKCKDCMKKIGREYFHINHDRQLKLVLIRRHRSYIEKRDFLNKLKDKPCTDCKKRYPFYVMDFDHKDPDNKIKEVAYMVTRNWSLDNIKKEVLKCDVVCANCHRIRTYRHLDLSR